MADAPVPAATDAPIELVHLERRSDGVAVITLDHPKMNTMSTELLRQLRAIAEGLAHDPPGAVVVTGGDRIFAAGAEIAEFGGPIEAAHIGGQFAEAFDAVAAIPRMVIAAVSGYALGGGCELALACDVRFASTRAKFGQPEVLLGIIPGGGGTQRLARLVGPARAKDLILTGRQVAAEEALAIGLVDRLVEPAELLDAAITYGAELAAGAVVAQGLAKQAIDRGLDIDLPSGVQIEQEAFVEVFRTEDSQIGTRSFLEKGPGQATFTGR
jgi:enoyl-CoA hydratase